MKRSLPALVFLLPCLAAAEPLDDAEVRLPYAELRRLLDERKEPERPDDLPATLAAARLKIHRDGARLVIDATFRTLRFSGRPEPVPLIGGAVSLESSEPAEIGLLMRAGMICHAAPESGSFTARLLADGPECEIVLPPCPSLIVEADDEGLLLEGRPLLPGRPAPLPAAGGKITLRALSASEIERTQRPPQPSDWSWQFQTLVRDADGELAHLAVGRASATTGDGLAAELVLPPDARDLRATGEDLASSHARRDTEGAIRLQLEWANRDQLEREVTVSYRRPLRPLDTDWQLVSPRGGGETRERFLIASNPRRAFEAPGLAGPFDPDGLPAALRDPLAGVPYFTLEGRGESTGLGAAELPLAATAEAVISEATWQLRQESDGSRLVEGLMTVEHRQPLRVAFESPAGFSLLTCTVNGHDTRPVDRGEGKLEIPLPPGGKEPAKLQLSFTAAGKPLDPVAGTLALALPRTPVFIRSLTWRIDLPPAYRSEVHGNLTRGSLTTTDPKSAIRLRKNLCRDEIPAVSVFYQRADLATQR